jgi:hypothetical protein
LLQLQSRIVDFKNQTQRFLPLDFLEVVIPASSPKLQPHQGLIIPARKQEAIRPATTELEPPKFSPKANQHAILKPFLSFFF